MVYYRDAAGLLNVGKVGVLPTDTVYGLVARAADQEATKRLYALKKREGRPGTLIAASIDDLDKLGIKRRYLTAVEQFWPGAVSVETPCSNPNLAYLLNGQPTIAIRIPDLPELNRLLEQTGPLITSSANLPGEPTSTTIRQARGYFGDRVDFYVDGGDMSGRLPSTIVRIVDDAIEVCRQGAVKINDGGEA